MKKTPRGSRRRRSKPALSRRMLRWCAALLIYGSLLCAAGLTLYCLYLSGQIQERFAGRRWSIPSKVYSDTTLLYPGQRIDAEHLAHKLRDLGYRTTAHVPGTPGEYRVQGGEIEISLRALAMPGRHRPAFPARITHDGFRLLSIRDLEYDEPVSMLELEPEEIMLFYGPQRQQRELISIARMPQHLIHAVLTAEDKRFYRHYGVDPVGILRAVIINLRHGSVRAGGSTITQQLAKCYFLTPQRTFIRKFKELCIALCMEFLYQKDEILEIYLNEIYLGQKGSVSINGVAEAAKFYFGTTAENLSISEAATLAGIIRAPNLYSPYADAERSRTRRDTILSAMAENGWLFASDAREASAAPLKTSGYAVRGRTAGYFMDHVARQLTELYSAEDLTTLGLAIYTTLDTQVQKAAEQALARGLKKLEAAHPELRDPAPEKMLQGAVVVMQPRTGAILALVGGRDYGTSQFNRITQARRQPGSAFKPLVYLSALDSLTPSSVLSNAPTTYTLHGQHWTPKNYDESPPGELLLRDALALSVNRPAVAAAMQTGLERIIAQARRLGITTDLKPFPSLALGSFEVIPLDLARAYCCFAADGLLPHPRSLNLVADERGRMLDQRHMEVTRATTSAKAFILSSLLQSVVSDGTARGLRRMGIAFPSAGKTGTTDGYRDAWYVGYTPDIVALVWVGFDDGRTIRSTGAGAALPIWAELMQAIPQHISGAWLAQPPGVLRRTVCIRSGCLAVSGACPDVREEFFLTDTPPVQTCTLHGTSPQTGTIKKFMKGLYDRLH